VDCNKEYHKNYYKQHQEKIYKNQQKNKNLEKTKEYNKKYYYKNLEKISEYKKNDRVENPEKYKNRKSEYNKKNPHIIAWRNLLKHTLNHYNNNKNEKTEILLGYDFNTLKNHIESLFTEGMSWENYGDWHIDHIKLLSSFDKNTSPSIVNNLSNLRPLWATTREINGVVYEGNLNRPKTNK